MPPTTEANIYPIVVKELKTRNVTILGDGIPGDSLNPKLFPELGPALSFVQVPALTILNFERFNFLAQPGERRVIFADTASSIELVSPIAGIVVKFLGASPNLKVSAIGFNFVFEVSLRDSSADFLLAKFFRDDAMRSFGSDLGSVGFKITARHDNILTSIAVEPVWEKPKVSLVTVNFHHEKPDSKFLNELSDEHASATRQVLGIVDSIFQAS